MLIPGTTQVSTILICEGSVWFIGREKLRLPIRIGTVGVVVVARGATERDAGIRIGIIGDTL